MSLLDEILNVAGIKKRDYVKGDSLVNMACDRDWETFSYSEFM